MKHILYATVLAAAIAGYHTVIFLEEINVP